MGEGPSSVGEGAALARDPAQLQIVSRENYLIHSGIWQLTPTQCRWCCITNWQREVGPLSLIPPTWQLTPPEQPRLPSQ